jgi:hypothetical protein
VNVAERITQGIQTLPESAQAEVLDFTEFLKKKTRAEENADWSAMSLARAMRGIETELGLYSTDDVKKKFT